MVSVVCCYMLKDRLKRLLHQKLEVSDINMLLSNAQVNLFRMFSSMSPFKYLWLTEEMKIWRNVLQNRAFKRCTPSFQMNTLKENFFFEKFRSCMLMVWRKWAENIWNVFFGTYDSLFTDLSLSWCNGLSSAFFLLSAWRCISTDEACGQHSFWMAYLHGHFPFLSNICKRWTVLTHQIHLTDHLPEYEHICHSWHSSGCFTFFQYSTTAVPIQCTATCLFPLVFLFYSMHLASLINLFLNS